MYERKKGGQLQLVPFSSVYITMATVAVGLKKDCFYETQAPPIYLLLYKSVNLLTV